MKVTKNVRMLILREVIFWLGVLVMCTSFIIMMSDDVTTKMISIGVFIFGSLMCMFSSRIKVFKTTFDE